MQMDYHNPVLLRETVKGLNIKEEDKQYLANIAKMGEGGDYEVKLTDDKGNEYTKKLSEVTQTEMDKLIKEQKEGPKTLEEIANLGFKEIEIGFPSASDIDFSFNIIYTPFTLSYKLLTVNPNTVALTGNDSGSTSSVVTVTATATDVFGNKISGKTLTSLIVNGTVT